MRRRIVQSLAHAAGNAQVLFVMSLPMLLLLCALSVDVCRGQAVAIGSKHTLDDAYQAIQAEAEHIKYAGSEWYEGGDGPDYVAMRAAADALAADGFVGWAQVTYFETSSPPQAAASGGYIGNDERHIVVEVVTDVAEASLFAGGGPMHVTDSVVATLRPYAPYRVWRPWRSKQSSSWGRRYRIRFTKGANGRVSWSHYESPALLSTDASLSRQARDALRSMGRE